MTIRSIATTALLLATTALAGCGGGEQETPTTAPVTGAAPGADVVPATLFAAAAPADAKKLIDTKSAAKPGDRVVFEARIGGRRDAFLESRAVFFVADPALLSCDQLHGDSCPTPWDYCCEPRDSLIANMATVQVVDASGQPLRISMEDLHGLAPLRTVYVTGVVDQADDAGTFVVNAESIHVVEG